MHSIHIVVTQASLSNETQEASLSYVYPLSHSHPPQDVESGQVQDAVIVIGATPVADPVVRAEAIDHRKKSTSMIYLGVSRVNRND